MEEYEVSIKDAQLSVKTKMLTFMMLFFFSMIIGLLIKIIIQLEQIYQKLIASGIQLY